jgi:hypothetical protein
MIVIFAACRLPPVEFVSIETGAPEQHFLFFSFTSSCFTGSAAFLRCACSTNVARSSKGISK